MMPPAQKKIRRKNTLLWEESQSIRTFFELKERIYEQGDTDEIKQRRILTDILRSKILRVIR